MKTLQTKLFVSRAINAFLLSVLSLGIVSFVYAVTPNPGHPWAEVGNGDFAVTGATAIRTYTFPDFNTSILHQGLFTQGDLIYGSSASTTSILPKDTNATRYLSNTGASNNPAWAQINLANGVSGALPIANGGTGLTTLTANNLLVGNGTSNPTFVAPGAPGTILMSDGSSWGVGTSTDNIFKRSMQILKNPGAATVTNVGFTASPTLTATASTADDADGPWLNHATTAVSANPSGVISAFTVVRRDWEPEYITTIKTDASAVTSLRYWVGLFSASPDASATPNIHAAAFRYDTVADGTAFWRTVTIAGTGASATVTTTSIPVTANAVYDMRILCANAVATCRFYINDTLVATHSATLPTSSTLLGYGNRVTTLSAAIRNIKWGRIGLNHN